MVIKQGLVSWLLILLGNSAPVFSSGTPLTHGAHVHGEAVMNIVLDGNSLFIELDSPVINLVGFEHAPNDEEQVSALLKAEKTLASADRLFHFATTKCSLENVEIEMPYSKNHAHKNHPHPPEIHHEHADLHANYVFQCEQAKDLTAISVNLFSLFPDLQEIKAQWIFQGKQGFASLTASHPTLNVN
ncbi:DUF2796 domain-containing protein [Nitrosomonas sp. Nm34]|uniref:DUF2796 domain-containing protein n=1 Tax=Nitrosomonas sp. Nm34 TaxID=1881055 RepID=UPI0008E61968|nr:DUF2796 domain-containing protein [Nitrosomonas sp. Nm34]SFI83020.1 Protein of unknown function [Nitrosomonas sp. Nm34]